VEIYDVTLINVIHLPTYLSQEIDHRFVHIWLTSSQLVHNLGKERGYLTLVVFQAAQIGMNVGVESFGFVTEEQNGFVHFVHLEK
jgi:hypothetical protein